MSTRRERVKAHNSQQGKLATVTIASKKNEHPIAKKMGDFFIDVAKLIIGGVILAGLMKQGIDYLLLFWLGMTIVFVFVAFGIYLINFANKDGNIKV